MLIRVLKEHDTVEAELKGVVIDNMPGTNLKTMSCTAYDYGLHLSDVLKSIASDCKEAVIEVLWNSKVIHRVVIEQRNSEYHISDRVENGLTPQCFFKKRTEKIQDRYLILVDAARDKNEFYKMTDLGCGEWGGTTGRIGEKQSRSRRTRNVVIPRTYQDHMFGLKILEKELNGYQDKSECHSVKVISKKNFDSEVSGIENQAVAELIEKLMNYAKMAIKANYTVSYTDVTEQMIKQAQDALWDMRKSKTVDDFNHNLISLMHIIPRKIDRKTGVKGMLASSPIEYGTIIVRESELLDIMESQINLEKNQPDKEENILQKLGLDIFEATNTQVEEVKRHLGPSLLPKLKRVFRIENRTTQKQFDEYLEKNNDPTVKLFWHGSRNENWFSIIQKGLVLNPDALITGKMFGQGVYFAPSAMKSWGYTSARNAKWTGGSDSTAFMALYATAYGNPYEVYSFNGSWNGYNYNRLQKEHPGCSCVHAKADKGMLRNDEIIFYREDQMTIQYICEFEEK